MGNETAEIERLRHLARVFGETQCRGHSAVYERLSVTVASNDDLLRLVLSAPAAQRRPALLFAAVNRILADRPGSALAAYYPIHGGTRAVDDGLEPEFFAFCAEHRNELDRLLKNGSTQTNEIRRCVALRLGLDHVRRRWPGPIALVEAGASAGLNLLFDHYRYRVGDRDLPGSADSPVTISCEVRGDGLSLGPPPEITSRTGLDLSPVDVTDPAARAWLEAFIWPEQTTELATLRGAIALAQSSGVAAVARGDAVTDLESLIDSLAGTEPVVVFTASLLSYLPAGARTAFAEQLRRAGTRRPVAWVFAEAPGLLATAGLRAPALAGPLAGRNTRFVIGASLRGPGQPGEDALLARADPYLRWVAPARHPADDFSWQDDLSRRGPDFGPKAGTVRCYGTRSEGRRTPNC